MSFAASSARVSSTGSAVSSKLMKIVSCSLRIFAAYATASSGRDRAVGPHFEGELVVVGLLTDARVGDGVVHLLTGENSASIGIVPTGIVAVLLRSAGT